MLVVDRTIRALAVTRLDPKLGAPAAVRRVGQLEVAVYDDDIARRFGPPATGRQDVGSAPADRAQEGHEP